MNASTCAPFKLKAGRAKLFAVAFFLLAAGPAQGQARTQTQTYEELPNFRQVGERLYRGGQPRAGGLARLVELGVNTVVNLRRSDERARAEEAEAVALGLRYFNVELPAWGRPRDEQVARVLEIIRAPESGRVFVHCRDGVDRTGTVVACYRIAEGGWSAEAALAEARASGMRKIQFWMRDYVSDYADERGRGARAWAGETHFGDRLGAGARLGEVGVRKSYKVTRHAVGKSCGSVRKVFRRLG